MVFFQHRKQSETEGKGRKVEREKKEKERICYTEIETNNHYYH